MNQTIELLKRHKSIRKYKDKPIDKTTLEEIIEAGQWASTSSFVQAYSIVRVNNAENRAKIAELSGGQKNVLNAPEFLVFCADLNKLKTACDMHDVQMDAEYIELMLIASLDAALVAQNVMIAAESLGLGGVYVGGIRNNPELMSSLLKLPERVYPVFGLCLGWPDQDPDQKPRMPQNLVLFDEAYAQMDQPTLDDYDAHVKSYYINRTRGRLTHSWTEQMSEKLNNETRPHMMSYLNSKKFAKK